MGETVPLKKITDIPFGNKSLCGKQNYIGPMCDLLSVSGHVLENVSCYQPNPEFRFSKLKIPKQSKSLKVACVLYKLNNTFSTFKKIEWFFYAEAFPGIILFSVIVVLL